MSTKPAKRVTRDESQNQTRQRLLQAARREVVRGGAMGASIRRICEEAGYTQGAFYANFESRDELLLQVMETHAAEEAATLHALVAESEGLDFDAALRLISERLADRSQTSEWSMLAVELQLHAQRSPDFAQRFEACKVAYHEEFARVVEHLTTRYRLNPALPSLQIAIGLYSLWLGFAAQGAVRGAWPRGEMLLAFFRAATGAPARST